jgi:hypothetical protein
LSEFALCARGLNALNAILLKTSLARQRTSRRATRLSAGTHERWPGHSRSNALDRTMAARTAYIREHGTTHIREHGTTHIREHGTTHIREQGTTHTREHGTTPC